jgi:hypothetical protein
MSPYLTNELKLQEQYVGVVRGMPSMVYLITTLLIPYTCASTPRKLFFCISIFGLMITSFMLGPADEPIKLPFNVWVVVGAFPLIGFF